MDKKNKNKMKKVISFLWEPIKPTDKATKVADLAAIILLIAIFLIANTL